MSDWQPTVPQGGERVEIRGGNLQVPPIIPFIEGDGTGPDIWRASVRVFDAAVEKAYGGKRRRSPGWRSRRREGFKQFNNWLPDETVDAFREYLVGIKGPLTTPVGGGIRSLNVALRQMLDLYVCLRPVRWFKGVPSPVKQPEKVDMVIFRENTEDIYAGIEYEAARRGAEGDRLPAGGISRRASRRSASRDSSASASSRSRARSASAPSGSCASAISTRSQQAQERDAGAQGQHHEVHRGRLPRLGLRARARSSARGDRRRPVVHGFPTASPARHRHQGRDRRHHLQQVLTAPDEYDVIATPNLNGDYLSDALAAQVGGIGIAPGGNINYVTGHAIFEATHGTAPKYAGQDKVNPGSVILSGEMMLRTWAGPRPPT
jgi:isocitrate dehydrogenase